MQWSSCDTCLLRIRFSKTRELGSSKANWRLRFSLPSIILADLLGNRSLRQRAQKVMVCDLCQLVDFDPFCVFLCFRVCCFWSYLCTYQCNAGGGGRQGIGWGFDFFQKFAIKFPAHGQIIPVKSNQISPPQAAHCCQSQGRTENAVVKAAFELQSSRVCENRRRLYWHVGVDQN